MKFIVLADKRYLFERFEPFRFFRIVDCKTWFMLVSLTPIFFENDIPVFKYI